MQGNRHATVQMLGTFVCEGVICAGDPCYGGDLELPNSRTGVWTCEVMKVGRRPVELRVYLATLPEWPVTLERRSQELMVGSGQMSVGTHMAMFRTSTGVGDGTFPVFLAHDSKGSIVGIKIVFDYSEDSEGEEDG